MLLGLKLWFTGVWPFIAHAGVGGLVMTGLIAASMFSPVFKREFVYAAVAVGLCLFVYGVGVHDEAVRRDAREQVLVKHVRDVVKKAIESGEKDPFDDASN